MFWPLTDVAGHDAGFLELLYDTDVSGTGKVDSAVCDEKGPPGWVSLTWADAPVPFDDVAVGAAVRACMRLREVDYVSTLTIGDSAIIGAVLGSVCETAEVAQARLRYDPFARLFPRRILRYGQVFSARRVAGRFVDSAVRSCYAVAERPVLTRRE